MSIGLLIILVIVASVIAWFVLRRGEVLRFETMSAPAEVIHSAISNIGTGRRWAVLANDQTSATFQYHKRPSKLIAFILFWFFIIPSIIYLVLAGKRESLAVSTSERPAGGTMVQIVSNGWRGKSAGRRVQRQLGPIEQTRIEPAEQLGTIE
jgi:hypothetical protein